uniref:Restriction of telomere capping protein 4 n=1 Tax=Coccidioides posadasii RMSCC 3488 TaxID=454284 RepID=A0A0J6FKV5_COCPO|nr:hypothetical protein CPAG_07277 [Coccidioides posadasii RMSCC 3488]
MAGQHIVVHIQKQPRRNKSDCCQVTQAQTRKTAKGQVPVNLGETHSQSVDSGYSSPRSSGAGVKASGHVATGKLSATELLPYIDPHLLEQDAIQPGVFADSAICPICQCPLDASLFQKYCIKSAFIPGRQQIQLCKAHRKESTKQEWTRHVYPDIDWSGLDERLKQYHPHLHEVLEPKYKLEYKSTLQSQISVDNMEYIYQRPQHWASYYGPRGDELLLEHVISHFVPHIHQITAVDKLVQHYGVLTYTREVLVPELLVALVQEDLQVDAAAACQVLMESTGLGDLVNENDVE